MSRRPFLIANWKLFKLKADAKAFCDRVVSLIQMEARLPQLAICPSYTLLETIHASLKSHPALISVGAQNMAMAEEGAYTGEVSAAMLKEVGVTVVILGHSERRQYFGETDATVNTKTKLALQHGLLPVICVGELLAEREAGQTDAVVTQQVKGALADIAASDIETMVFAYEPVWAIGTGKTCDAVEANRVCELIRQLAGSDSVRVLYGGSVKPDNFDGFMAQPSIDGGLVGGASLDPGSFVDLIEIAQKHVPHPVAC